MKLTYTQVGTLFGCAMELCHDDEERARIADYDAHLRETDAPEQARAEFLVDALYQGIVNGDWEEEGKEIVFEDLTVP